MEFDLGIVLASLCALGILAFSCCARKRKLKHAKTSAKQEEISAESSHTDEASFLNASSSSTDQDA